MNIEQLRKYCLSFPGATEDIKWKKDLCFCVGAKMFCVTCIDPAISTQFSFKCTPEKFTELTEIDGIIPAPYAARYHWVAIHKPNALPTSEIKKLVAESYKLVFDKLPPKVKRAISEANDHSY